ncbi:MULTISPECIES: helix-turn-helix transcriptional regulator [Chryseobacterium]|uniref:helix-turn-helix transcriptional regulator n=1 Tax=Chryseobacterium sp. R2A-55 TaxID=2744445 RepID=UPI001F276DB9|nr:WYL domain-containing protein [Chryseobacterium sp. R2A-55]
MAKRDQMLRLIHISNLLQTRGNEGATYHEILRYLEEKHHIDGYDTDLAFSEKTFKRDRNLLFDLFGIETKFKRSTMTYQIADDENLEQSKGIFDNLLLVNAYKKTADQSKIMFFEKRQASGLHNLEGIIHAIKHSKLISFKYTKYDEGISQKRIVEPYALKEFRNRWYLLANESNQEGFFIKTYGLDRLTDLEIHKKSFKKTEVDIEKMFVNSFGIITSGEKPKKMVLSFDAWQGQFVKSLPIHHSQKTLVDNKKEYRIEITLIPTYDFYQELFTHAERLRILEPKSVREQYLKFLSAAQEMNKD